MKTHLRSRTAAAPTLAALTAALLAAGAASAAPAISVMPPEIDFGRVEQQEAHSGEFVIRNQGDQPLKILDVSTSCGCTAASPGKAELAPGESTKLEITFNSKDFQGPQHKTVTIRTNDPARPVVEVTVLADVHSALMITPPTKSITFGNVLFGQGGDQELYLSSDDVDNLQITPKSFPDNLFEMSVVPGKDDRQKVLKIHLRDDAPVGPFREVVALSTNVPDHPTVEIETSGIVTAAVDLQPTDLNFRYAAPNMTLRHVFKLVSRQDKDVKVTSADIDLPGFKVVSIKHSDSTKTSLIEVVGQPLPTDDERVVAAKGRMIGTLTVHTDDPAVPQLTATVKYLIKM